MLDLPKDLTIKYENGVLTMGHKDLDCNFVAEAELIGDEDYEEEQDPELAFQIALLKAKNKLYNVPSLNLKFNITKVYGWMPKDEKL